MKKLSLLIFITLIFSFAFNGCKANESQKLAGSWKYGYNISAQLNEVDEKAYFDLEEHKADLIITFNDDNTYTCGFDDTSLKTALEEIKTELVAESEDYIRKVIADQGAVYRIFADSVVKELLEETKAEIATMVDELYAELSFTKSGTFLAENGKLYWDSETDEYDIYISEENTLTLNKPDGTETDELYPMVFTKVK